MELRRREYKKTIFLICILKALVNGSSTATEVQITLFNIDVVDPAQPPLLSPPIKSASSIPVAVASGHHKVEKCERSTTCSDAAAAERCTISGCVTTTLQLHHMI